VLLQAYCILELGEDHIPIERVLAAGTLLGLTTGREGGGESSEEAAGDDDGTHSCMLAMISKCRCRVQDRRPTYLIWD